MVWLFFFIAQWYLFYCENVKIEPATEGFSLAQSSLCFGSLLSAIRITPLCLFFRQKEEKFCLLTNWRSCLTPGR